MSIVCIGLLLSIAMDSGKSQDGGSDGQVQLKNKGSATENP
jgi:hypothetical protein